MNSCNIANANNQISNNLDSKTTTNKKIFKQEKRENTQKKSHKIKFFFLKALHCKEISVLFFHNENTTIRKK